MLVTLRVKRRDLKLHIIISSFKSAFVLYHIERVREGKSRVVVVVVVVDREYFYISFLDYKVGNRVDDSSWERDED